MRFARTTFAALALAIGAITAVSTATPAFAAGCTDTYMVNVFSNGTFSGDTAQIDVFNVPQHVSNGVQVGYQLQWGDNTKAQTLVFSSASGVDTGPAGDVPWSVSGATSHSAIYGNSLKSAQICAHEKVVPTTAPTTTVSSSIVLAPSVPTDSDSLNNPTADLQTNPPAHESNVVPAGTTTTTMVATLSAASATPTSTAKLALTGSNIWFWMRLALIFILGGGLLLRWTNDRKVCLNL